MPRGQADFGMYAPKTVGATLADMADLAVRLGSIVEYDRRGDVIYIDDFETPKGKYIDASYGTGSKAILDSSVAKSGAQSIKLVTGGTINQYSRTQHYMPLSALGRLGLKVSASLHRMDAFASTFVLWLETYTGTQLVNAKIQIDVDGGILKYFDENGWQTFESGLELYALYSFIFHNMKMVIDLDTNKYVRFLIDSLSYDLSAYSLNTSTNTRAPYSVAVFTLTDLYGRVWNCWLDDLVFTINEP